MTVNLTFDIADILGTDFDSRRTKVWLETNIEGDVIIDATGNTIRLGHARATINTDGTGSFTGLPATNGATNPTAFQYQVHVDYPDRDAHNGRGLWASGWFSLTATADLADVAAEAYVPPTWMTTATATLQGYVDEGQAILDQQETISGLTGEDAAITAIDNNPASAFRVQQDARHSATYASQLTATTGDQTSRVQAFLDAASPLGVKRLVGAFTISAALTLPGNTRVDLSDATLTLAAASNSNGLLLPNANTTLVGGTLDMAKASQTSGGAGILITAAGCSVERTSVLNAKSYGVHAVDVGTVNLDRVTVTASDYIGIFVETPGATTDQVRISRCVVDRSSIAAGSIVEGGIKVRGASGHLLTGVSVTNNYVRMPVSPTDATAIGIEVWYSPFATVAGNQTRGGAMGLSLAACDNITISGNTVYNAKTYGIELAGCRFSSTTGNTIDGNALTTIGIVMSTGGGVTSDYSTVALNTITGVTTRGIQNNAAIDTAISGNTIKCPGGYLIELISAHGGSVTGNTLDGLTTALKCVMMNATSKVAIVGNTMQNVTQTGVMIYGASAVTMTDITITGNAMVSVNTPVDRALSGGAAIGARVVAKNNAWVWSGWTNLDYLDFGSYLFEGSRNTGTSPEGAVGAVVGSKITDTTNGNIYLKRTGSGTTGWVTVTAA